MHSDVHMKNALLSAWAAWLHRVLLSPFSECDICQCWKAVKLHLYADLNWRAVEIHGYQRPPFSALQAWHCETWKGACAPAHYRRYPLPQSKGQRERICAELDIGQCAIWFRVAHIHGMRVVLGRSLQVFLVRRLAHEAA